MLCRLAVVAVMLWVSACEVATEVTLTVAEDGSGSIDVVVGLDDEALDRVGEPEQLFATADLVDSGWTVSAPTVDDGGFTRVRASRDFGSTNEAEQLLAQVDGAAEVFDEISLVRSDSFTTTTYTFGGVADLSGGLAVFSDPELAAALDGEPLGESVEAIEERFGAPIPELFSLTVTVDLPGEPADGGASRWTPELGGEPVTMEATSEITDRTPWVWVGVAVAAVVAAIGLTGWRFRKHRAARRSELPQDEAAPT
jgi:hypothetical protein